MIQIIGKYKYDFLFFLFKFFFKLKIDFLASIFLILSIKEFKELNNKNSKKKILIFFKSGGVDDLRFAFSKYRNHDFKFYHMQRRFFRVIFDNYFKFSNLRDYHYIIKNKKLEFALKNYNHKISKYIKLINRYYHFKAYVSFNPFYMTDREIQKICSELKIKFISFHKECVGSPLEDKIFEYLYKNKIEKFMGSSISVYSEKEKNLIIKSKFAKKNQVVVTGSPRCDISYSYRKLKPDEKTIVYYMIENYRGAPWHLIETLSDAAKNNLIRKIGYNKSVFKINWKELSEKTLKYCVNFARKNKNIKLIIKGKQISHQKNDLPNDLPENITFVNSGAGHHLLKKAKIVIGFNTTAVLEGVLANRDIIIPYFDTKKMKKNKDLVMDFNTKQYAVQSEDKFYKKLNFHLNKKYHFRELNKKEKNILKKFVGNSDGNSSKKLSDFLKNEI